MLKALAALLVCTQVAHAGQALGDYEIQLLDNVRKKALKKPSRVIEENEDRILEEFILFAPGPIIEAKGLFRYGNEYVLTARKETKLRPQTQVSIQLEISLLELTYCNYRYESSDMNRFQRKSLTFNNELELIDGHRFTRIYDPATNGRCISGKTENEKHSTEPLALDSQLLSELHHSLKNFLN